MYAAQNKNISTNLDWELLENLINILTPFREATNEAQSEMAPISLVIPLYKMLERFLNRNEDLEGLRTMVAKLLSEMDQRFASIFHSKRVVLATCLDPRFKLKFFSSLQQAQVKSWLKAELEAPQDIVERPRKFVRIEEKAGPRLVFGLISSLQNWSKTRYPSLVFKILVPAWSKLRCI